uniref:Uncharacterized protein n=1 Tax=Caenorhabditis japonica TaxID=281687 RepID=A0A8R1ELJ6_CAEJA
MNNFFFELSNYLLPFTHRKNSELSEENNVWAELTDQDLLRIYFLLTTTNSKNAINRYFDVEVIQNEVKLKKILFQQPSCFSIKICSMCAENVERCSCPTSQPRADCIFCCLSSSSLLW